MQVFALGLGRMRVSEFYEGHDGAEAMATSERAFELGNTSLDTADMHGSEADEELLRLILRRRLERVVLVTNFGVPSGPGGSFRGLPRAPRHAADLGRPQDARLQSRPNAERQALPLKVRPTRPRDRARRPRPAGR